MDLDKFLNLLAAIFGTLGAIYVMLSIITMSPEIMFRQASTAWGFSESLIDALASQQADNIAGFVFVILAFLFAAITVAFVPDGIPFKSTGVALALAAVIAGGLYITLHFISQGVYKHQRLAIVKIPVSQFIDEFRTRGVTTTDVGEIAFYVHLLKLDVVPGESTRSLLQRVANAVGKALPPNLDYSAVEAGK